MHVNQGTYCDCGKTGKRIHISREGVQRLVEVVHLHQDAEDDGDPEHVCAWVRELVVACECELDRDAEALDRHDRYGADERAYRDVYQRVGPAILRNDPVYHDDAEHEDRETIHHKT